MTDFGKVQADIVKNIVKTKQKGGGADYGIYAPLQIGMTEYVPVVYRNVSIFLIPRDDYLLDPGLCKPGVKQVTEIFAHVTNETMDLVDTGLIKQYNGMSLVVLVDEEGIPIFVDAKLLKPFGKGISFRKGRSLAEVYVLSPIGIEGMVLTVRVEKQVMEKAREEIKQICKASPG